MKPRTCPICRKEIPVMDVDAEFRPFCSPRCKTIDLGGWLEESYRVSRTLDHEDLDSGARPPTEGADDSGDGGTTGKR